MDLQGVLDLLKSAEDGLPRLAAHHSGARLLLRQIWMWMARAERLLTDDCEQTTRDTITKHALAIAQRADYIRLRRNMWQRGVAQARIEAASRPIIADRFGADDPAMQDVDSDSEADLPVPIPVDKSGAEIEVDEVGYAKDTLQRLWRVEKSMRACTADADLRVRVAVRRAVRAMRHRLTAVCLRTDESEVAGAAVKWVAMAVDARAHKFLGMMRARGATVDDDTICQRLSEPFMSRLEDDPVAPVRDDE